MTIELIETRDKLIVSDDGSELIQVITQGEQGVGIDPGVKGVITIPANLIDWTLNDNVVTSSKIVNGTIVNADINDNAAIALTKLATGALPTGITVTSANISDLSIVNADINASAAIAGTKISPDFGSQNIVTTGTGATGALGVTGNITVSGTVDGRDVATDGTKLDGIETGATADQTAAEILTLIKTVDGAGSGLNADLLDSLTSSQFIRSDVDSGFDGTITANSDSTNPILKFQGTGPNYIQFASDASGTVDADSINFVYRTGANTLGFERASDSTSLFSVDADDGQAIFSGNLDVGAGLDVTGNITVSGTVDGVDIAALNTTVGNLSLSGSVLADGTTATTQSASDNSTKVATTAYTDTAISNLVNSAPSTLDTLKELSDALGSDPNFATTVTNSIATKLPLAGGTLTGDLTIENTEPQIFLKDSNNNDDFTIRNTNGVFTIRDSTNAVDRLTIDSNGKGTFTTALDVTGDLTVESTLPQIILKDTNNDDDFTIKNTNGVFTIRDSTNGADRFTINSTGELSAIGNTFIGNGSSTTLGTSATFRVANTGSSSAYSTFEAESASGSIRLGNDGTFHVTGNTNIGAGLDVTGNITVTGTVDGRDIATDGTKLDGIESNATADQTASEIVALVADQTIAPSEIDMEDNEKIKLGTGDDLQIYHSGSASFIDHDGTGNLVIRSISSQAQVYGTEVLLMKQNGIEKMFRGVADGTAELYYDNSTKLETTSEGIKVTTDIQIEGGSGDTELKLKRTNTAGSNGNAFGSIKFIDENNNDISRISTIRSTAVDDGDIRFETRPTGGSLTERLRIKSDGNIQIPDNNYIYVGDGNDLRVRHDATGGNHSYIFHHGTGAFKIASDTQLILGLTSAETFIECNANDNVELYYDNSKKLETTSAGVSVTGDLGLGTTSPNFSGFGSNTGGLEINDVGSSNQALLLSTGSNNFYIANNASTNFITGINDAPIKISTNGSERLRIESDGNVKIPADNKKLQIGASQDLEIYHNGSDSFVRDQGTGGLYLTGSAVGIRNSAANEDALTFAENAAVQLFFDNSKKLETTSSGITVNGAALVGGNIEINQDAYFKLGAGQDLQFHHDGSSSYITNSTGFLFVQSNDLALRSQGQENFIVAAANGGVQIYYDNSNMLETINGGARVNGVLHVTSHLDMTDSGIIKLGDGDDLQIKHSGTDSVITHDTGSGLLRLNAAAGGEIHITKSGPETLAKFIPDGAVELYFNNSKKFETTSAGVNIPDNAKLGLGSHPSAGGDLLIWHNGSDNFIDTRWNLTIRKDDGAETLAKFTNNASVDLYYDNAKKLETTSTGVSITGNITASGGQLTLEDGNQEQIHRFWSNNSDSDIYGLLSGSTFGTIVEGSNNGHHVIALRGNDTADSFAIVSGGGNYGTDDTYDTLIARFYSNGVFHMPDSNRIKLGTGNDLQLYHDGTDSYLQNETNDLFIDNNGDDIVVRTADTIFFQVNNTENTITARANGAVELYYDNSKKLETTSYGGLVTGQLLASSGFKVNDGVHITLGTDNDFKFYHDGSNAAWLNTTGNNYLYGSGGNFFIRPVNGEGSIDAIANGSVSLYYDNSKKFESTSTGANVISANDAVLKVTTTGTASTDDARIELITQESSFIIQNDRSLGTDGALTIGDGTDTYLQATKDAEIGLYFNNSKKFETTSTGITVTGTVTETSDIALKSDIQPITNSLEKIQQIKGCKYTLNSSVSKSMGVIAQDVEKVFPELVHGSEGNKTLQYSGLIGVLIEAVKDLSDEVAALKAS